MTGRVLVVDDDSGIRRVLRAYLEREGFEVTEAADAATALELVDRAAPDLLLLDLGLPDADGLEVLRTVRERSALFVVVVSARAEEVDRLVGLGVGADDYVTKPFSPREVVARVRAVLRRSPALDGPANPPVAEPDTGVADLVPSTPVLEFTGLRIDPDRHEVVVDGDPVSLSPLEFQLLHLLAGSPGRVFSRGQLIAAVWGPTWVGDERVVDVHVRSLRQRLADPAGRPRIIGTVRGVGYRFLPEPV